MSADPKDDDPTHALDDFMRRMRPPTAPPAAMPDLSDLDARLHAERNAPVAKPRGGKLRSGQTWSADDVVDVPEVRVPPVAPQRSGMPELVMPEVDLVAETAQAASLPEIDLPPVRSPAPPDPQALDHALREANSFAAGQWQADAQAAAAPAWQPDPHRLQLRPASHARLPVQWQPGCWVGALRQVLDSRTEFVNGAGGPAVETYAPQLLWLLWTPQRPDRPLLGRWPQQVRLSALPREQTLLAMLANVPDDTSLWLCPAHHDIDWSLAAEIALHHEPGLRPFQIDGLRSFLAAEREASFARINSAYGQPDAESAGSAP